MQSVTKASPKTCQCWKFVAYSSRNVEELTVVVNGSSNATTGYGEANYAMSCFRLAWRVLYEAIVNESTNLQQPELKVRRSSCEPSLFKATRQ